ncbi:MFS general substrate transporter [Durotheca rogersii]|uniref:MFS general substrate transporter n=1 Tax=Durotheca rogersii TaxID=419775 RepID=UPI00222051FA|nr:MFS general substrate transporter [Durotheca rogersii]KAI5860906.1 MFS general substrate transporter [Durotheca rogersii]
MGREVDEEARAPLRSENEREKEIDNGSIDDDVVTTTSPTRYDARGELRLEVDGIAAEASEVRWRDLPNKDQLFILSLCRLSEPLSNVCLLPYIFYLVRSVLAAAAEDVNQADAPGRGGNEAARVSEYSGLLVAAFPLAQFAVSLPWGWLSDKRGRRLSIIVGLTVSAAANVAFGFSKSFGALLFWRILAGLANGNVGIMRTVTAEIVRERKYQTKAFLLLPLVFNAGMVASLALGGCLAEPVVNLPWLFGPDGLLNTSGNLEGVSWVLEYPYALPVLLNAVFLGASLLLAVCGLRETLPGKDDRSDVGLRIGAAIVQLLRRMWSRKRGQGYYMVAESSEDTLLGQAGSKEETPKPDDTPLTGRRKVSFRRIWTRRVMCALVSFGLLPLHNSAFMHIFPVYLSSPPEDNSDATAFAFSGGLGLRSSTIGLWLSTFGICGILLQLFIYPRLQARIGTRGVFRIALFLFPATYAAAPYLSLLADGVPAARWVLLGLVVCAQIMARTMAIPSTVILLTEAAPANTVLGTIHGAGNMLASLARAIGPAIGGHIFAVGVERGIVGLVWWLYLLTVALAALAWSYAVDRDAG